MKDHTTGAVTRGYLRNLKLSELSGVDNPANPGAKVALLKGSELPIAKIYASNDELPEAIKNALPDKAQSVFREVVNSTIKDSAAGADESSAFKQAWGAVKQNWKKNEKGDWIEKMNPDLKEKGSDEGSDQQKNLEKKSAAIDKMTKSLYSAAYPGGDAAQGARSFASLLAEYEERKESSEICQELWPLFDALRESVTSILADDSVGSDMQMPMIRQTVEQFMASLPEVVSEEEAEGAFYKLFSKTADDTGDQTGNKGDYSMPDNLKEVEALKAQVDDLTKKLAESTATVEKMAADAKAAAEDEVIKIDDKTEVRKSVVGPHQFAVFKAQQEKIDKAESERELVVLTKVAETDYAALPGEPIAKAKVLKEIGKLPEEQRTELEKMLKAGSAAIASTMKSVGHGGPGSTGSAQERLDQAVEKFASDNKIATKAKATSEFLKTEPGKALYAEIDAEKSKKANAA